MSGVNNENYVPGHAQHIFLPLFPTLGAGLVASVVEVVAAVFTVVYRINEVIESLTNEQIQKRISSEFSRVSLTYTFLLY